MARKRKSLGRGFEGISQRKNGRFEYRYIDPLTHKRKSISAGSKAEAKQIKDEIRANMTYGIYTTKNNITLDEMYYLWKNTKRGIKPNTFRNYTYMYERYVLNGFGKNKLQTLIRTDIKAFYNSLYDSKVMKVNTMDCIHNVIHQVLELAVDNNYIRYNPASNALKELKREESQKARECEKSINLLMLNPSQERLFFEYLEKHEEYSRWNRILKFLAKTGLRIGEMSALQISDIDNEKNFIDINKTLVSYSVPAKHHKMGKLMYEIHSPKTKASKRTIPLTEEIKRLVEEELDYHREFEINCKTSVKGANGKIYEDFLFLNCYGNFYKDSAVNKALQRIIEKYNEEKIARGKHHEQLPKISVHKLRHMFNSNLKNYGIMVEERMSIMGHSSATVNMDVYTHVSEEAKTRAMLTLEEKQKEENANLHLVSIS